MGDDVAPALPPPLIRHQSINDDLPYSFSEMPLNRLNKLT